MRATLRAWVLRNTLWLPLAIFVGGFLLLAVTGVLPRDTGPPLTLPDVDLRFNAINARIDRLVDECACVRPAWRVPRGTRDAGR